MLPGRTGLDAYPIGTNLPRLRQAKFCTLLTQNRLPGKFDSIAFNGKHFDQDLIAFAKLIFDLLHAMFCDLGDMQEPIGSGKYLVDVLSDAGRIIRLFVEVH